MGSRKHLYMLCWRSAQKNTTVKKGSFLNTYRLWHAGVAALFIPHTLVTARSVPTLIPFFRPILSLLPRSAQGVLGMKRCTQSSSIISCSLLRMLVLGFSFLLSTPTWAAGPYSYIYDQVGRVIAMTDSAGNTVEYDYDAVGNVIAIKRPGASSVSIIDFTPHTGTNGTAVAITGTGFSAQASANTVKFNGLMATVSSATSNKLVVTAPIGVTTGPISVTSPLGSTISSTSFLAGGALLAPTITSFTPTIGSAGTVVTVTGTNFDTGVGHTKVLFNQTPAFNVSVPSTTGLTAVVPTKMASGKMRVITPAGYVDSVNDFIIPPSGIVGSDIVDIKGILVGGAQTLNITPANKVGLLLFDASSDAYLTLNITALTTLPAASLIPYQIYSPNGALLISGNVSDGARFIDMPRLPQTGTYSIYFMPGAATATLSMALAAAPALALDGVPSNATLATAGHPVRLTFIGSMGQNLGLGITGLMLSPVGSSAAYVFVYSPDGSRMNFKTCYTWSGCKLDLINLPMSGVYSVLVTPQVSGTGSFTATLSSDVTGSLTLGAPLNLSLSRAGQNGRPTFSGTVGDILGLALTGVTVTPALAGGGTISVYKPDGILLTVFSFFNGNITTQSLPPLPTTGIYSILIDPSDAATARLTLLLTPAVQAPLTLDGASSNVTLGTAGQPVRLTFTGSMGQNLGLGVTGLILSPAGSTGADVTVYSPDGSKMNSTTCYATWTGCELNLSNLPMSGTYSVVVMPQANGTGSFTATLSSDAAGGLTAGTPLNLNLNRAGQNGRLTFSRNVGTTVAFMFSSTTIPAGQNVTFTVYQPDGASFGVIPTSFTGGTLTFRSVPVTGTYTLLIDPSFAATATMSVTLSP